MLRSCLILLLLALSMTSPVTQVGAAPEASGLPLPRFVSLRADEVNMRAGPGTQYPVEWVYRRQAMPVEVINEYRHWRKVRDWQGDEGWIHKTMLSARRTAVVVADDAVMSADPAVGSPVIARLEPGVIGHLVSCPGIGGVCLFAVDGIEGWVRRAAVWGLYAGETIE